MALLGRCAEQLQDEERRRKQQLEEIRKREVEERAKQEEERSWREVEERAKQEEERSWGRRRGPVARQIRRYVGLCF